MANEIPDFTNYTVNVPHQAAWLVYINGIEIPVVQVDVSFGVWNVPEATLQMVPHVLLQRVGFEDRLQVQIFYLDEFYDARNPEFKLLYEYEVVGWSYTNTGMGRFIQLSCRGHLQIMEQLHFYYMSSVDDIVVANSPSVATDGGIFSESMVYYPYSLFLQGLIRPVISDPTTETTVVADNEFIRSPFEFISNVFRAVLAPVDMTSTNPNVAAPGQMPRNAVSCPGRNFFGRWMNMTDFRRRWAGLPSFDDDESKDDGFCFPLVRAVQNTEALIAVQQQIGESIGHAGSMWDLLSMVFGVMYYEISSVPAPPIVDLRKETGLLLGAAKKKNNAIIRNSAQSFGGILSYCAKPRCIFGIPPTCNIIFPSMVTNYSFNENYMDQPTRIYVGEQYLTTLLTKRAANEGSVDTLVSEALTTGYPKVVQNRMKMYALDAKQNTKNFLLYPEELYKGPITKRLNAPSWLYMLSKAADAQSQSAYAVVTNSDVGTSKGALIGGISYIFNGEGEQKIANKKAVLDPIVKKYAAKYNLPVIFIYSIIRLESGYSVKQRTLAERLGVHAGGLFQILPGTAKGEWARIRREESGLPKFKDINYFDAEINIHIGTHYLRRMLDRYEVPRSGISKSQLFPFDKTKLTRLELALCGYNAGPGNADKAKKLFERKGKLSLKHNKGYNLKFYGKLAYMAWSREEAFNTHANATPAQEVAQTSQPQADTAPSTPEEQQDNNTQTATGVTPASSPNPPLEVTYGTGEGDEGLGTLFELYAKYEFYRSRFESRGGSVSLAFNPYIVPGFPAVVFDEKSSGFDTVGYVTNVKHSMSAARGNVQMATQVSLSYMRTFAEFFNYSLGGILEELSLDTESEVGPPEPIAAVAEVFQVQENAEKFYKDMFYPGVSKPSVSSWSAAFDWLKMLDVFNADGLPLSSAYEFLYEDGLIVQPTRQYQNEFRSYDAAMAYVARPVCTLRQYIELRHGKSIDKLVEERNKVQALNKSYFSNIRSGGSDAIHGGASFWARIDAYVPGPGDVDSDIIAKVTNVDPVTLGPHASEKWDILSSEAGIPQTRRDWDKMLRKYRKIVRGQLSADEKNPLKFVAPQT